MLLTALAASGYLRVLANRYRNGPWVKRWILDPKRGLPNYLKLQLFVWWRLEQLGEIITTGRPPDDMIRVLREKLSLNTEQQEVYTRAMRELAGLVIPPFLKRVRLQNNATRLLDIGGAHGDYARALVRRFPGLKATVMDLAGPIATGKKILREEGNPEGIELRVADALEDDLGSKWNVVLLANMVHGFGPEQNRDLFRRIHAALAPGGVLLILDQFTGLGRLSDFVPALISVNLFTVGGKCYELADAKQLLKAAGFGDVRVKRFGIGRPSCLIEAWSPATGQRG